MAGLFVPAMAWLLALVDLAAAAVGELVLPPLVLAEGCLRASKSTVISPASKAFCKQTTIFF